MSPAAVRKLRLAAYALAVMAGLWLPASKIIFHALPLHEPAVYRFAASCPYDAGDPFRGRYVALRLEALPLAVSAARQLPDGRVFLALARGADGLAAAADARFASPAVSVQRAPDSQTTGGPRSAAAAAAAPGRRRRP